MIEGEEYPGEVVSFVKADAEHWKSVRVGVAWGQGDGGVGRQMALEEVKVRVGRGAGEVSCA